MSLVEQIGAVVGAPGLLTGADAKAWSTDWRKRYFGEALAVVRPSCTEEVAKVVRLCAASRTAIVPQGGNTGLCGGATPDASGSQIVLSLTRMNRVRAIDTLNNTLTVEAGCVLAAVQQAAEAAGRLFPLSLAAEGTAQIGGNLSTNAGGTAVLRYGNTRELTLGLEVVLPSGEIWDGLRGLRKDNTGYDMKHLFIGAEGSLGIITAAVMKLFPLPRSRITAIAALRDPQTALSLLSYAQERLGSRLTGFELFSDLCLALVLKHYPASIAPFKQRHAQYVLIELSDLESEETARTSLEAMLGGALESGLILDAAVSQSISQFKAMWALRDNVSEAQAHEGPNIKHDVTVPISRMAEFITVTDAALARAFPGMRNVTFGHLGDGNLHYNVSPPEGVPHAEFLRRTGEVNRVVHDSVARFNGSISAEHGLGQYKREEITRYKSAVEMEMMRGIKKAIDPMGIMNPGKVL